MFNIHIYSTLCMCLCVCVLDLCYIWDPNRWRQRRLEKPNRREENIQKEPQELDHAERQVNKLKTKKKNSSVHLDPSVSSGFKKWKIFLFLYKKKKKNSAPPPPSSAELGASEFGLSYCPAALAAFCCSSMDLRAGDITVGDMAGVKGRSG